MGNGLPKLAAQDALAAGIVRVAIAGFALKIALRIDAGRIEPDRHAGCCEPATLASQNRIAPFVEKGSMRRVRAADGASLAPTGAMMNTSRHESSLPQQAAERRSTRTRVSFTHEHPETCQLFSA